MTGFASISREDGAQRVNVTIKSVNHRFLDVLVKAGAMLAAAEGRIRSAVHQRLTRGRVELTIGIDFTAMPPRDVTLDEALLAQIAEAMDAARAKGLVTGALSASDVLRIPQVLDIRPRAADAAAALPDPAAALVDRAVGEAMDALVIMRETEGRFLAADLDARLRTLAAFVDELEQLAREGQGQLEARLRERLGALPPDIAGDPGAVAQEIVRFVARSDVDEEVVRLRGHLEHWRALADGPEACGRKLDFLVQEMNREINTIGSKAEGARATEVVIAAKAELERLREQVQNVE
ncbi:MAG TPA: YicC/YloC family endoribonuclease [Vicinamibacterales bacterium]|nr:YicC/YloC family endoribonuclease [Vicinamibacterales bacterium]